MRFLCVYKPSKPEAVKQIKEFLSICGDGKVEIRQVFEPEDDCGKA